MKSDDFYKDLPVLREFTEVGHPRNYHSAPSDWSVVITDVRNSTKAIEQGLYKEVNVLGASSVAALLNATTPHEIPFIFGGDGASFLIPNSLLPVVRRALLGVQELARDAFSMDLRAGIVSVHILESLGQSVKVAKLRISPHYEQAVFTGGGLSFAEKLIKDPANSEAYLVSPRPGEEPEADFSQLTCRWNDIQSRHGETISLLVKALPDDDDRAEKIYRAVIDKIHDIYGDADEHHPVPFENLRIAMKNAVLSTEAKLHASMRGRLGRFLYHLIIKIKAVGFHLLSRSSISFGDLNFKSYRDHLITTVDYRKFDDVLRLVISGTTDSREKLVAFLESERAQGNVVFGIHASDRALMTCLVYERYGKQVHFIDGADGGYALAAKQLKQQLSSR